jgi:hypothetical protein
VRGKPFNPPFRSDNESHGDFRLQVRPIDTVAARVVALAAGSEATDDKWYGGVRLLRLERR